MGKIYNNSNILNSVKILVFGLFVVFGVIVYTTGEYKGTYSAEAAHTYTIEFDLNGGIGEQRRDYTTRKVSLSDSFNLGDPSREGYVFNGWKLENFDTTGAYISSSNIDKYVNNNYLLKQAFH